MSGILVIVNVSMKKKVSKLIVTDEKCKEIIGDTTTITENRAVIATEHVKNCKPFVRLFYLCQFQQY